MASAKLDVTLTVEDLKETMQKLRQSQISINRARSNLMAINGDPNSLYQKFKLFGQSHSSSSLVGDVEVREPDFDPAKVDWRELMTLYQDDPLLMAVFLGIKEYFDEKDGWWPTTTPSPSFPTAVPAGGGYSPYLSGITTSTGISVDPSPTYTLKYDTSGNFTIDPNETATFTWKTDEE
jgi:hypothetical protein